MKSMSQAIGEKTAGNKHEVKLTANVSIQSQSAITWIILAVLHL